MMSRGAEESLLALLEAMLTLAAQDIGIRRPKPAVKPGGYPEEMFVDLTEEEKDGLSCNICYQILKDAMECKNKHKFCHSCLFIWSTTGQYANRVHCPVCRGPGQYYRSKDVDDQVTKKKVHCHLDSCQWVGPLLQLGVHKHTTYNARVLAQEEAEKGDDSVSILELPYLGRAPPRPPRHNQTRFTGTGLTARLIPSRAAAAATSLSDEGNRSMAPTHSTSVMQDASSPGESMVNILLRDRRGINGAGATGSGRPYPPNIRLPVRRHVSPLRLNGRITLSHVDDNNNQQPMPSVSAALGSVRHDGSESGRQTGGDGSGFSTPRTPRPPSGPPPASLLQRRNLPSITSQRSRSRSRVSGAGNNRSSDRLSSPSSLEHGRSGGTGDAEIPVPDVFNAAVEQRYGLRENLTEIRDRLQESRQRLNSLMNTFGGELERSRQEMADFQMERERQRREQLNEVQELGRRLGQVASELRQLLDQRRSSHSSSLDD